MKIIRLLYPDYVSGGLETYYFGANLMAHILPSNEAQPLVKVEITPPDREEKPVKDGIYAKDEVLAGIQDAMEKIESENPDRIITIGGNCMVSLAPFDYLHGKYKNTGIIWIDAHPDVSMTKDGYPNAHAMVLGSLMGYGDSALSGQMKNEKFKPDEILYVGLQSLHDYQKQFHSTYFANEELVGDGSGGGRMTMEKLEKVLHVITENSDVAGFTIAEYLPFDEHHLHKIFSDINIFTEK